VIALLGLATTPASPAVTSAPSAVAVTLAPVMTSAIVIAALVGASAAIIAQWVSQQLTTDRETRARRRKEERVRKLFAARVKTLAFYSTELANVAPGALATRDVEYSIQDMEEAFEPLAREFAIFELSLSGIIEVRLIDHRACDAEIRLGVTRVAIRVTVVTTTL
jgi:hypothetical protein